MSLVCSCKVSCFHLSLSPLDRARTVPINRVLSDVTNIDPPSTSSHWSELTVKPDLTLDYSVTTSVHSMDTCLWHHACDCCFFLIFFFVCFCADQLSYDHSDPLKAITKFHLIKLTVNILFCIWKKVMEWSSGSTTPVFITSRVSGRPRQWLAR